MTDGKMGTSAEHALAAPACGKAQTEPHVVVEVEPVPTARVIVFGQRVSCVLLMCAAPRVRRKHQTTDSNTFDLLELACHRVWATRLVCPCADVHLWQRVSCVMCADVHRVQYL